LKYAKFLQPSNNNLVFCGGVSLNCNLNSYINHLKLFDDIYIPPGSNDASTSIGAAFEVSRILSSSKQFRIERLNCAQIGKEFTNDEIQMTLINYHIPYEYLDNLDLIEKITSDLSQGMIIAWHMGKSEFGPRALGGRSLLGDPRNRNVLFKINKLKGREQWRPLAPSILEEDYLEYFKTNLSNLNKFMLTTATLNSEKARLVPAITHIDFTTRPHIVSSNEQSLFYNLIQKFKEKTGIPLIVNTSLNNAGEPLSLNPVDSINFFTRNNLVDRLAIGNFYIDKRRISL
jgi:carbamoyltransferase